MSARPNWRHYHIVRNGHRVNERLQRYRAAWQLVSRLARTSSADSWRVFECSLILCHAPRREALS